MTNEIEVPKNLGEDHESFLMMAVWLQAQAVWRTNEDTKAWLQAEVLYQEKVGHHEAQSSNEAPPAV